MYLTEHRVEPRDTRAYAGLLQRLAWRCRRWAEAKFAYSRGDVLTYGTRARAHQDDHLGPKYRRILMREIIWMRLVWKPLARLFGAHAAVANHENDALPGDKAILEWLNEHPALVHVSTGGARSGLYLEWYSLSHAPWSGQREDWLLWTEINGSQDVDGPLSTLHAQELFLNFENEYRAYQQWDYDRWNDSRYTDTRSDDWRNDDIDDYEHLPTGYGAPIASAYVSSPVAANELTDDEEKILRDWRNDYIDAEEDRDWDDAWD